jgi:hypothetical protein
MKMGTTASPWRYDGVSESTPWPPEFARPRRKSDEKLFQVAENGSSSDVPPTAISATLPSDVPELCSMRAAGWRRAAAVT